MNPEPAQYSPTSTLTAQQHHVLALLAEGRSVTDAALEAGIHRNTVANWRRTIPAFSRECESAIREQAAAWYDRAVSLAPQAAEVLHEILHDPNAAPALRLRAALAVLKTAQSPRPEPPSALYSFRERMDAVIDGLENRHPAPPNLFEPVVQSELSESCTNLHNATIRRPPQPGRNAPCTCGSGQKYKRCCSPDAPLSATAKRAAASAA